MKNSLIITLLLLILFIPFSINAYDYVDALEKGIWFFDANRCGPDAGSDNVFSSWRGACHTSDSDGAIDLTGGYHDAGDHVKFGLPQGWSAATLGWSLYEYRQVYDNTGITPKMLSVIKYFTDYFLRSHPNATTFYYQVGDGNIDHGYWGSPELQTGDRPTIKATPSDSASDVTATTAAALALMYLNYKSTDQAYANQCLQAAIELYAIAMNDTTRSSDGSGGNFYKSSSHYDDLSWGGIWLAIATGDNSYLDPIENWLDTEQNDYGDDNYDKHWAPAWDDVTVYVLLKMYQLTGKEKFKQGVLNNLEWYRDECTRTPYGLPWLDSWGVLRYASSEAGLGYLAKKFFDYDGYMETADLTMNYCLGDNPRNGSYLTNWGNNPSQHPHHRANEPARDGVTNGMIGALCGGPNSGDGYTDDVNDYTMNEVAIDYNASFILGISGYIYHNTNVVPKYTLTVNNGTGDGTYGENSEVTISGTKPDLPIDQKAVFSHWSGDVATVDNIYAETTTMIMPGSNATVTANYDIINVIVYELTAVNATGSGFYEEGTVVDVEFDIYQHPWETITFQGWSGDTQYLANASAESTTLTMPASDVTVTAEYTSEVDPADFYIIPCLIEAEEPSDFLDMTPPDFETEQCSEGGLNVAYIDDGEWMDYYIESAATATYNIELRVARGDSGSGAMHVEIDGENVSGSIAIDSTGGWQNWVTLTVENVAITSGRKVLRLAYDDGPFNVNYINIIKVGGGNIPPVVSLTSPSNGATYTEGDNITVSADASDSDGTVSLVEFYAGSTKIGEDSTSPYSITWSSVAQGSYAITAVATDNDNDSTTSTAANITVNPVGQNVPPTVSLTSPSNGATYTEGDNITVSASASDSDGTVSLVEFYAGSTKIGEDSTSPYSITWSSVAQGSYAITAVATDNDNDSTTSTAANITVNPVGQNVPPTVSITSPSEGESFTEGNNITVSANASDSDGTVSLVEFYAGSTKIGEDSTSPYSITWSNAAQGDYAITAVATDNDNDSTTSQAVNITVIDGGNNDYVDITVPFVKDGSGEFYWKTTTTPNYINSWNLQLLEINGVDLTNVWKSGGQLPPKQDGYYYIHYVGSFPWSHFEAK